MSMALMWRIVLLAVLLDFLEGAFLEAAGSSQHYRSASSGPAPPASPPPSPLSSACKCPDASPCAPGWITFADKSSMCIQQNDTEVRVNQNCSRACGAFAVRVPWESASTQRPADTVPTQAADSWVWVGGKTGLKGALEFITGDQTHCTMVYFEAGGGNITNGALAVEEALRWVATQRSWLNEAIPVRQALRYMWGCGPACKSTSALVDVESKLARMKCVTPFPFFKNHGL